MAGVVAESNGDAAGGKPREIDVAQLREVALLGHRIEADG